MTMLSKCLILLDHMNAIGLDEMLCDANGAVVTLWKDTKSSYLALPRLRLESWWRRVGKPKIAQLLERVQSQRWPSLAEVKQKREGSHL